jgi:hypothetical protein
VTGQPDPIPGSQLAAPPDLRLVVDECRLGAQQRLDLAAAVDDAGQLEQLTQPDRLAVDWNLAGQDGACVSLVSRRSAMSAPVVVVMISAERPPIIRRASRGATTLIAAAIA